jgi:hypothetical protein
LNVFICISGSKWSKKELTYKISKYGKKITKKDVDHQVDRAFAVSKIDHVWWNENIFYSPI